MSDKMNDNSKAFTLVELSIVLLIIGLIIGGITAGSSLINQSKIRAIISEINSFKIAINGFKLQFGQIPGDFTNAYAFWGTSASCTNVDVNTSAAGCNGNGNGIMDTCTREGIRAWQHLNLAGFVAGSYTGLWSTTGPVPTQNVPGSKFGANAGYEFGDWAVQIWQLTLGAQRGGDQIVNSLMNPTQAYNIDVKMDDGVANKGATIGYHPSYVGGVGTYQDNCTDGNGNYLLTSSGVVCVMSWLNLY
jgi:prepilin-type N-terminal cleavage/methylation domain-containing protein